MKYTALLLLAACASPPTGPNNFTEHMCRDGSYCPNDWDCGGDVPSCPSQLCCDQEPNTTVEQNVYGERRPRVMWKRIP